MAKQGGPAASHFAILPTLTRSIMDGRKSLLWACCLLGCAGCINGGAQKNAAPPAPAPAAAAAPSAAPPITAVKDDPKSMPRLRIAFAKYKEEEAKGLDRDPEQQFKVRDQARMLYQEALQLDAGCLEAYRGLGRVYVDLSDFDRAQETLKKAVAKFPKESIFWYELGQLHNRRKDFPQAIQCLNKALEMDPENRVYITTLGLTLARAGQTEQSVVLLARSMGLASAHYNVGRMLMHLQRTEEGLEHVRQAMQLNPNLEGARQLLGEQEQGTGQVSLSIEFLGGQ
jgi:tetratricopeptide (TPR) repeat protein